MVDLEGGERAVAVAHLREAGEGEDAAVGAEVELPLFVGRFLDVHHGVTHHEHRYAALGEHPEQVDELRGHLRVAETPDWVTAAPTRGGS